MDETLKRVYANRRARLAKQLGEGEVLVIPTAPNRPRNRDSEFPYRHDSYFYYLTGFTEPHAWLILSADGRSTLFCQPKDLEREIWDGYRLGPEATPEVLGVDEAFSVGELDAKLPSYLENRSGVWYPFATHEGLATQVEGWLGQVRARVRFGVLCPTRQMDACALLDEMRLFKDGHELDTMRKAAQISAAAHMRAMQTSARMLRAGLPVHEYHLEAELLHEFRRHGSQFPAYTSIVAAGANACVLHYRADNALLRAGELVLIDAGCELDGYASDITRTFPADGRFGSAQKALYEIVLAAQDAAAQATRPGASFQDPHLAAIKVLSQGLLDVGLLDRQQVGTLDDVIEKKAYFRYYMHRTSHWLGMDVHDCGSYVEPEETGSEQTRPETSGDQAARERHSRILKPGMVLTLEPGLYVRPAADVPEPFWNIGIRIEDDAVVTETGCELISRDVPVSVTDIEALMREHPGPA